MLLPPTVAGLWYVRPHDTGYDAAYPAVEVWLGPDAQRAGGLVIGEFGLALADEPRGSPATPIELPRAFVYRAWCHIKLCERTDIAHLQLTLRVVDQLICADCVSAADPARLSAAKREFWRRRNYRPDGFATRTAYRAMRTIGAVEVHVATYMRLVGDRCLVYLEPRGGERVCETVAEARQCVDAHVAALEAAQLDR